MSDVNKISYERFFSSPPSESSLVNASSQVKWETAKIYTLRAVQITTVVALVAIAAVGFYFLASSVLMVYPPAGLALATEFTAGFLIGFVTGRVAKSAFNYFQSCIDDRSQQKLCYKLFEKLHPEALKKAADTTPPTTKDTTPAPLVALDPHTFFEKNKDLFKEMAALAHPFAGKVVPEEVETKRIETSLKLQNEAQELVEKYFYEIETEIQPFLDKLSPLQREFAHLRLSQALYAHVTKQQAAIAAKEAQAFSWIPSAEILKDIEKHVNKEAAKIVMLSVASWTSTVAIGFIAGFSAVVVSPNILIIGIILFTANKAMSVTSNWLEGRIRERNEVLRSYTSYAHYKEMKGSLPDDLTTQGVIDLSEGMWNGSTLDGETEAVSTTTLSALPANKKSFGSFLTRMRDIFYQAVGSRYEWFVSDKQLSVPEVVKELAKSGTKVEIDLPKDKVASILSSKHFTELDKSQKHFWALKVVETIYRKEYEDQLASKELLASTEKRVGKYQTLVNQWTVFDGFSKAGNALAKALETTKPHDSVNLSKAQEDDFDAALKAGISATLSFRPVETEVKDGKRIAAVDQDDNNTKINQVYQTQIAKLEELNKKLDGLNQKGTSADGEESEITPKITADQAILELRALLKEFSKMSPLWCEKANAPNEPLQQLPMLLTSDFIDHTLKIYQKLIASTREAAFAMEDQLIQNTLNRIAALIREHSKLFAEVVKARDAKKKLDKIYDKTVNEASSFATNRIARAGQLAFLLASDELGKETTGMLNAKPQLTQNPRSLELEWDKKKNQFKGDIKKLTLEKTNEGEDEDKPTLARANHAIRQLLVLGNYDRGAFVYRPTKNEPAIHFSVKTAENNLRERTIPLSKLLEPKDPKKLDRIYFKMVGASPLKPESAKAGASWANTSFEWDDNDSVNNAPSSRNNAPMASNTYLDWLHSGKRQPNLI